MKIFQQLMGKRKILFHIVPKQIVFYSVYESRGRRPSERTEHDKQMHKFSIHDDAYILLDFEQ